MKLYFWVSCPAILYALFGSFLLTNASCHKEIQAIDSKALVSLAQLPVRYKDEVFQKVDTTSLFNFVYRLVNLNQTLQQLKLDAYFPAGDTVSKRPAILHIHGGMFTGGSRKQDYLYCQSLAKRGFVVISIDYRLGIEWPKSRNRADSIFAFHCAVHRALQDSRAALRFIRKSGPLARIDTSKIFVSGTSAGAATAINVAYVDHHEVPDRITSSQGPLDGIGEYDYPGYSTKVKAVINREAPISDTNWMKKGDAPVVSVAGTQDVFYYGSMNNTSPTFSFNNIPAMHRRARNLGIPEAAAYLPGGAHGSTGEGQNLFYTLSFITDKIYPLATARQ